ncbi:hypothetical protein CRYUN_Cryun22dG0016500 [Craigia yunnanensis]
MSLFFLNARGGTVYSHNTPSGISISLIGGSSTRGHGSAGGGSILSGDAYCRQHEITVTGDGVPPPFTSFEATGFPSETLREVHNAGFSAPTPIQAQSWPVALQSRDIVAIAKTGAGKTLGYLIPGFIHLKRCRNDPQMGPTVLVLSPTRELATQIQAEAIKFGKSSRISCTCLYGGARKGPQLREIERGVDIVLATPGRLNDILEMRKISLHQVSYLVLDEADRMLDMGFEPQIRKIVNEVPTRRQTLMYTATWPREVRKIAADLLVNPVQVNIGNIDELVANKSITQFRSGWSPVLVATDVAARGLDIKGIRVVINSDFPTGVEDYVHRIGRTGRAGATRLAYTFFGDQDSKYASDLIKVLGANQRMPTELRDMALHGGRMGRPRRWAPSFGGRDGGCGGRTDSGYDKGRSRSRSPAGWGDRHKNTGHDRSRSRSPDRYGSAAGRERSPPRSFHEAMMKRVRSSPPQQRGPPHNNDNSREHKNFVDSRSP